MKYLHENENWTDFKWDEKIVSDLLKEFAKHDQILNTKMGNLGFSETEEAKYTLELLTDEIISNCKIEGENLNMGKVRSSVARNLGMPIPNDRIPGRHVEGMVKMTSDAIHTRASFTAHRLFEWHKWLFPTGFSDLRRITVGAYRDDRYGPMKVVSGSEENAKVHYVAPDASRLPREMELFLQWLNSDSHCNNQFLKSAIAHYWFLAIHPMDDGNGRISRAISEMILAKNEIPKQRFYSISPTIEKYKKKYCETLEALGKNEVTFTEWLQWYLNMVLNAIKAAEDNVDRTMAKTAFFDTVKHREIQLNKCQVKVIKKLFGNFEGKLNTKKWMKICKCDETTAVNDIEHLLHIEVLVKTSCDGQRAEYGLNKRFSVPYY